MVVPKEQAVTCEQWHARAGRLAQLGGFYLPGRDTSRLLDQAGLGLVLVVGLGLVLHLGARVTTSRRHHARRD